MSDWRYEMMKKHHLCTRCGEKDAYTIGGRILCYDCTEKHNAYMREKWEKDEEFREKEHKRKQELKNYRIENRLCVRCGKPLPEYTNKKQCGICRAKDRRRVEKKRIEKGCTPRFLFDGVTRCKTCGKEEVVKGYKLCSRCLENSRRTLEIARNTPREPNGFEKSIRNQFKYLEEKRENGTAN